MYGALIVLALAISIIWLIRYRSARKAAVIAAYRLPDSAKGILETHVSFYQDLGTDDRLAFEDRVRDFLARARVTGVGNVVVEDMDRILIAASAIIPIFHFAGWRYQNINEVLLYPDRFNKTYKLEGDERNVLGMVGDGAMQRQMIISQQALRGGFAGSDGQNTAIHEFVHLIDKADGSVDGIPEYLLSKPYIMPWIQYMQSTIKNIKQGNTDINPYGGTNDAEFFAVVSEYFFEKPAELEEKHPELYQRLKLIFQPKADD